MSSRRRPVAVYTLLLGSLCLGACASEASTGDDGRPTVVATTTIVGDLVRNVAGDEAEVEVLMPSGADPHEFQASAQQAALLREADLVVTSGLGLEQGLEDVIEGAHDDGVDVLELGPLLDPLPLGASGEGGTEPGSPDQEGVDPHWWLDPLRAADAVRSVGARLEEIAAGGWADRAARYAAELESLDREIQEEVARLPTDRRKLVTSHDSLGYFATRYGFEVIGVLIPGGSTAAEPSAAGFAELVEVVRREDVPAIFAETTLSTNLAEALAREVGREVSVVVLYTGSLDGPGSSAATYVGMMRTDLERIVDALG